LTVSELHCRHELSSSGYQLGWIPARIRFHDHRIVGDVLDFSKLESGDFPLDVTEIDLQLAIGTVVTSIQMKADMLGRGTWIRTYFGVKLPRHIQCDSKRLQQIVYNLLGNAVKFSPDNAFIDLHLDVVESVAPVGNGWDRRLRLKIKDYGIGIHKENFGRVFEPFHQESAKTCTTYGGTGLGLSVTKRLAEKLGGTVVVDSEVGKWTQFTVDLPFEQEEAKIEPFAAQLVSKTAVLIVNGSPTEACPFIRWHMDVGIPVFHMFSCDDLAPTAKCLEDENPTKEWTFITFVLDSDFCGDTFASYAEGRRTCLISFGRSNRIGPAVAFMANPCLIFPCMMLRIFDSFTTQLETGTKTKIDCSIDSSLVVFNEKLVDKVGMNKSSVETIPNGLTCYKEIGLRVLIAEDNKVNQKVLKRTLNRLGLDKIDVVDNGKEAYDKVHQHPDWYDVIFMDMEMPVMGGVEACRHIAVTRKGTLPLIIFVTAHAMDDFRSETKEAGGNGFISKPFNVGIIDKLLRSFQWDQLTRRKEGQPVKIELLSEASPTEVACT